MFKRLILLTTIVCTAAPVWSQESSPQEMYFNQVKEKASQGDPDAQICLGDLYAIGLGTARDLDQKLSWYRSAEKQGDHHATLLLSELYMYGSGVPKDTRKGLSMLHALVDGGYLPAATDIGLAYAMGIGLPKDQLQTIKWYEKAAEANDYWAAARLALIYHFGEGVQPDPKAAKKWLDRAANSQISCLPTFGMFFPYIIDGYFKKPTDLPEHTVSSPLIIGFTYVNRHATDLFVYQSSGVKALDDAWLEATREAILPPWPSSAPSDMNKLAFMVRGSDDGDN